MSMTYIYHIENFKHNDTTNVGNRFNAMCAPIRRDTNDCFETRLYN
jgi:hypothetical protein